MGLGGVFILVFLGGFLLIFLIVIQGWIFFTPGSTLIRLPKMFFLYIFKAPFNYKRLECRYKQHLWVPRSCNLNLPETVPKYFKHKNPLYCIKYRAVSKFFHVLYGYLIISWCTVFLPWSFWVFPKSNLSDPIAYLWDLTVSSMRLTKGTCLRDAIVYKWFEDSLQSVLLSCCIFFPWMISLSVWCTFFLLETPMSCLISYSGVCPLDPSLASSL